MIALRILFAGLLAVLPVACRTAPVLPRAPGTGPAGPVGPGALDVASIPEPVHTARRLIREHRRGEALRVLEEQRPLSEAEPERTWLLVAIWSERYEGTRARRAAATLPDSAYGAAVRSLAAETPIEAMGHVGPWLGGRHPWVHIAAAVIHAQEGDHEATEAAATRALDGAPPFVAFDASFARARARMEQGKLAEAEADARNAAVANPRDARGPAMIAELERRRGDLAGAVHTLLRAMALAPRSEAFPRRIAELLREQTESMPWDAVEAAVRTPSAEEPAERIALRGLVQRHRGEVDAAIVTYRAGLAGDAIPVPNERELRELLAGQGRYPEVIELLLAAVPTRVQRNPQNLRQTDWQRLVAFRELVPGPGADPGRRLELGRTFVRIGALAEASAVLAPLRMPQAQSLRRRVDAHRVFERALHREIEAGYRVAHEKADPPSIERVLVRVRELAETHLDPSDRAIFRDPTKGTTTVPIIGTWLDHHTRTRSPVVAHFRRYGKFLMMGQRNDLPTEAIVLSIASLTEQQPIPTPGGIVRHDVAIGYDRTLRGFIDAQGGALGGACLADGMWLDADSTRRSENDLRRSIRLDAGLLERVGGLAPQAPHPRDGVFALSDPGGVMVRLVARYMERAGRRGWGSFATLEAHEGSHALDVRRHLPIVRGLPNTVPLLARNGFSPARVEMELERRAQLGAALLSTDSDLAVAEMLLALPVHEREPEVHDGGYRDALVRIVRHVHARHDLYPQIDRTRRIVNQLDRLSNAEMREAARAALRMR